VPPSLVVRPAVRSDLDLVFAVDDDASRRYRTAGVVIDLALDHPFIVAERRRWTASLDAGHLFLAEEEGAAVGIAALGTVDGAPYLDQLSVRMAAMGRGVGSALVAHAIEWASGRSSEGLFLTTYAHLAWNLPFYARRGFVLVAEREWGPEMRVIVRDQRECLPAPDQRAVMRWRPPARGDR
jgi:GNAT superfamily N-acetyltransferase